MSACCGNQAEFTGASSAYRRVLWLVIIINAAMFLLEMLAGASAGSMALQADALDFLADATTYTISLLVIGHSLSWRAGAALFKGISLAVMGIWVLGSAIYQILILEMPVALIMSSIGFLALTANVVSALLLYRFRDGDANVRSVWLCTRNDAIGNIAVIIAALAVWWFNSGWPDLVVALAMASLFLYSAVKIIRQAVAELQRPRIYHAAEKPDASLQADARYQ